MIGKVKNFLIATALIFGVVFAALFRIRSAWKADAENDTLKAREKLQGKYDEIDRSVPDVDAAYDRLRRMRDADRR